MKYVGSKRRLSKDNKRDIHPRLLSYIGFNSYGAKFFGGYRRDKEGCRDYWGEHYRHIMKQIKKLEGG